MGRRFFLSTLGIALAIGAVVIAFNAWVDPFQHYRKAERFPPRFLEIADASATLLGDR